METSNTQQPHTRSGANGFALLMTLIVVTVILSIGLSVLDLSTKQIRLSTNAKDSEVAFHAANAGMECARYIRRQGSASMEIGNNIAPSCFGVASNPPSVPGSEITSNVSGDGEVFKYEYSFTWADSSRCSVVTTLIASSTASTGIGATTTISQITDHIPGYPESEKECAVGERCTVISVRGYNKPCNSISGYGTVEREVLLQF